MPMDPMYAVGSDLHNICIKPSSDIRSMLCPGASSKSTTKKTIAQRRKAFLILTNPGKTSAKRIVVDPLP
jgi:hypothetical protein